MVGYGRSLKSVFLVGGFLALVNNASAGYQYAATYLGPDFYAVALNNNGQVVGSSSAPGSPTVFWSNGAVQTLNTQGRPNDLNDSGVITGTYLASGISRAFIYQNGNSQILGTLGGRDSFGMAINNSGQIAGSSDLGNSQGGYHATLYSNGVMQDLGALGDGRYSRAIALNNNGDVIGGSYVGSSNHAFIYKNGVMQDLTNLIAGAAGIDSIYANANAINDNDVVVGGVNGYAFAFSLLNNSFVDLGVLSGGTTSAANAVNNIGDVVGSSFDGSGSSAFLYTNGQILDLNALTAPLTNVHYQNAFAINNAGQILVSGYGDGYYGSFLLNPVPLPAAGWLFGAGLVSLFAKRKKFTQAAR